MRHSHKTAGLIICLVVGGLHSPCWAKRIKLAHLAPVNDPRHQSLQHFAELVSEKTNGALSVTLYPKASLGKDREVFEQLQGGITELALNAGIVSNFYPRWTLLQMPYLWQSQSHLHRFLHSPRAQDWIDHMERETGVRVIAFFDRNPRILTTRDKPIAAIQDLQGLKIRVPAVKSYLDTWKAFGARPTPMSAKEFYLALRLGAVDGMENPIEVMDSWKIYEVSQHLCLTEHMREVLYFTASARFLERLSASHRQAVVEAAQEAAQAHALRTEQIRVASLERLSAKGMIIELKPELADLRARAKQVHATYMNTFGEAAYQEALLLASQLDQ